MKMLNKIQGKDGVKGVLLPDQILENVCNLRVASLITGQCHLFAGNVNSLYPRESLSSEKLKHVSRATSKFENAIIAS